MKQITHIFSKKYTNAKLSIKNPDFLKISLTSTKPIVLLYLASSYTVDINKFWDVVINFKVL